MSISDVDKNFEVKTNIQEPDIRFYNVLTEPFSIHGVYYEDGKFRRLSEDNAALISKGVHALCANTAGGRVRFVTDSPYVAISVKMGKIGRLPHMALTGSAGFDLYVKHEGTQVYHNTFIPPADMVDGYESITDFMDKEPKEITINFPPYSEVMSMYIGVSDKAKICSAPPYSIETPVVYYGSSITQGGCVSRPGNAYPAIVSRSLDCDYINLGFAGNAKGEKEMAEYIAGLTMSAFVLDYDHNALTCEHLEATHKRMYEIVRAKSPGIPIVIMPRPNVHFEGKYPDRLAVIEKTYRDARDAGDDNVYYISDDELAKDCFDNGTVDTCHPNDYGHGSMAKAVINILKILED